MEDVERSRGGQGEVRHEGPRLGAVVASLRRGFTVRDWLVNLLGVYKKRMAAWLDPPHCSIFVKGEKKQHETIVNIIFHAVSSFYVLTQHCALLNRVSCRDLGLSGSSSSSCVL
jgi:hypothetical protein